MQTPKTKGRRTRQIPAWFYSLELFPGDAAPGATEMRDLLYLHIRGPLLPSTLYFLLHHDYIEDTGRINFSVIGPYVGQIQFASSMAQLESEGLTKIHRSGPHPFDVRNQNRRATPKSRAKANRHHQ